MTGSRPSGSTLLCASSGDCSGGDVCCQGNGGTCQASSVCGARGNRQLCTMSSECPAAYPDCVMGGGGVGTCRVAPDAGVAVDSGTTADSGTAVDSGAALDGGGD